MNLTTQDRYEQYELRMQAIGRLINWIISHRIQLAIAIGACVAFLAFLAIVPGMFVGDAICPDITYGDVPQPQMKAILSDTSYEYAALDGAALWSEVPPTRTGSYRVRAVSQNGYGKLRYSDEVTFSIYPAEVDIRVKERTQTYGEISGYSVEDIDIEGLRSGDMIARIAFASEDVSMKEMLVSISELSIVNLNGEDVTECYSPNFISGALYFEQRVIGLASSDVSKNYDGKPLKEPFCEIVEGSLAEGNTIEFFHDPDSVIIEPGTIEAKFSAIITDAQGRDVTENYKIDYHYGTLSINTCPVTIGIPDIVKYYDGTPLEVPEFSVMNGRLVDGSVIEVEYESATSITKVGLLQVLFKARIFDASGRDVTDFYALNYVYPTLIVSPNPITVASADVTKIYDAKALYVTDPFLMKGTLADGDVLKYSTSQSTGITNVGSAEAQFTAQVLNSAGEDVTDQYEITYQYGTLTVQKRPLEVLTASAKKVYDGTPLKSEKYTIVSGTLVKNHSLVVTGANSQTNAGVYDNFLYFVVKTNDGIDVSENYEITTNFGTLEISFREITVRAESATKVYDGTPLTSDKWKLVKGTVASGQKLSVVCSGSQTDVGKSNNTPSVKITDKSGNDVTELGYRVTIQNGTLEVTQRSITLTSESDTKIYDGKPLTNDGVKCTSGSLVLDHYIDADVTGSQTQVGKSSNYFTARILTKDNADVTHNYKIQTKYGTLEVIHASHSGEGGGGAGEGAGGGPGGEGDSESTMLGIPVYESIETVFQIQFEQGGSTLLRHRSYGDYTGSGFLEAPYYEDDQYSPLILAGRNLYYSGKVVLQTIKIYRTSDPGYALIPYYSNTSFGKVKNDNIVDNYSKNYSIRAATDYDYRAFEGVTCNVNYQNTELKYREFVYANYMSVPESTRRELQAIANKNGISKNSKTLIKDIQVYVQNAAKYNLQAAPYPKGVDQVIYFLTVAKEGVCQQYAATATLLYRMYGIPARYTVGYSVEGEAGVKTDVLNNQAHAWVEIYLDGIGWVAVDVTGSSDDGIGGGSGSGEGGEGGEGTESGEGGEGGTCPGGCNGDCDGVNIGGEMDKIDNLIYAKVRLYDDPAVIYLRDLSYGNYTGTGWTHAQAYKGDGTTTMRPIYFSSLAIGRASLSRQTTYIRLMPGTPTLLPYYVTGPLASPDEETDVSVQLSKQTYSMSVYTDIEYSDFANASLSGTYLTQEKKYRQFVYENYLDVPESTKEALLEISAKNGISANSKTLIEDVQKFISTCATYNLYVGEYPQGVDVVLYFLNVAKEGYCQHFASAATLMYRALGIPARYTCGFMKEVDKVNELISVTGEDAHAWVEVYLDGKGWVQIEVTAALTGYPVEVNGTEVLMRPDGKVCVGLTTFSAEKEYDGLPFDESLFGNYYLTSGNLIPGHKLVVEYDSDIKLETEVQTLKNTVTGYKILDKSGKDVTDQYVLDINYGTLVIRKRSITVSSMGATKVYDGTELIEPRWWIASGSLAKGHVMEVTFNNNIIANVGTLLNYFTCKIFDSDGNDVTAQYQITRNYGKLTVTPAE